MKNRTLDNCKYIKGVLMIFVILGHSVAFWTGNWFDVETPAHEAHALKVLCSWLGSFHTYAFVLISGYIFAFKMKLGGYSKYSVLLKNKAKRLLVSYFFVTIIWLIPFQVFLFKRSMQTLRDNYLFCNSPEQLWFLWMLFWIFVIYWPLKNILDQKWGWILIGVLYCIGVLGYHRFPNYFRIWDALQYMPLFYLGIRIRVNKGDGSEIKFWHGIVLVMVDIILFVISSRYEESHGVLGKLANAMLPLALHMVGALMIFVVLQYIFEKRVKAGLIIEALSKYSLPMYLFHQQLIYLTILWLNGKINPYFNAAANFIFAIVGSILISVLLTRWKVTRVLIGERG